MQPHDHHTLTAIKLGRTWTLLWTRMSAVSARDTFSSYCERSETRQETELWFSCFPPTMPTLALLFHDQLTATFQCSTFPQCYSFTTLPNEFTLFYLVPDLQQEILTYRCVSRRQAKILGSQMGIMNEKQRVWFSCPSVREMWERKVQPHAFTGKLTRRIIQWRRALLIYLLLLAIPSLFPSPLFFIFYYCGSSSPRQRLQDNIYTYRWSLALKLSFRQLIYNPRNKSRLNENIDNNRRDDASGTGF